MPFGKQSFPGVPTPNPQWTPPNIAGNDSYSVSNVATKWNQTPGLPGVPQMDRPSVPNPGFERPGGMWEQAGKMHKGGGILTAGGIRDRALATRDNFYEQMGIRGGGGGGGGGGYEVPEFTPELLGKPGEYLDTQGIGAMRSALSGQDDWLAAQQGLAQSGAQQAGQNLRTMGASQMATQQGNLAMRGGLTSGAQERMGQQNLMGQLQGQQQIGQQLSDQQLQISGAADQRRRELMGQLAGQEMQQARFKRDIDQWNVDQRNKAARDKMLAQGIASQGVGG